jgi:hypothetical protein
VLLTIITIVAIVAGAFALRRAVSVMFDATLGHYAQTHVWFALAGALGLVIWAVLAATGVVHGSPYGTVKAYFGGTIAALALIMYGIAALKKRAEPR